MVAEVLRLHVMSGGGGPELTSHLRIEERELEAAGWTSLLKARAAASRCPSHSTSRGWRERQAVPPPSLASVSCPRLVR